MRQPTYFQKNRLRLVEFNVENLFIYLDHYQGQNLDSVSEREWQKFSASTAKNKPLQQVREVARAILELKADIVMLCEVGGKESLDNFNRLFLGDLYAVHLMEGNSERGIDIGYLVKKSLPFRYDLISHKSRTIDFLYPHEKLTKETGYTDLESGKLTSHRFSRDVLELRVFEDDVNPCLILLLVHLKSQLDPDRIDPGGRDRRRAELEKLVQIYKELDDEFAGKVPVMLTGDFNGLAAVTNHDPEFGALYSRTDLRDALEVAGVAHDERFTHMQLPQRNSRVGAGVNRQLDYIFIPAKIHGRVNSTETWVYRFKDHLGMGMQIPRNYNEKKLLCSDHYPVVLTLDPEA
ncbi:MAG: hypothetical protein V4692_15550 [Bdellovibrionota bacterium]